MIIKDQEIYVLETNTIPGMTETSLLPLAAKVAGYTFESLIQKLLELALRERR
jgi:D-alanine-D-alanine ligase